MLRFHILNVEQGDSIVIEHHHGDTRSFGVVDSNAKSGEKPRALSLLKDLGASTLSFVCLTHPHRDHYRGLSHILEEYSGKIDQFILFPAGEFLGKNTKKLAMQYLEIANAQDSMSVQKDTLEFIRILMMIDNNFKTENTMQYSGPYNQVFVNDFLETEIHCILPFSDMKGSYLERIRKNDATIFESENENDISIALMFTFKGIKTVLGGDATAKNWAKRLGWTNTRSLKEVRSTGVKLPHHGSKRDCTDDALSSTFHSDDISDKYAFISANGVKHPDLEVLRALEERGIKPYCTNLHPACGANVERLVQHRGIDPVLAKYINELSVRPTPQPCQGDITFTINDDGTYQVTRERNMPCGFRGEFADLFGIPN